MKTECHKRIKLSSNFKKDTFIDFDGGNLTSDAGLPLIKMVDDGIGLSTRIAEMIVDKREQGKITHRMLQLLQQRLYQLCLGYEDCNDSGLLRDDAMFKVMINKLPETEGSLASQPTLTRLENSITKFDIINLMELLISIYAERKLRCGKPKSITIDIDATDDPTHGEQQYTLFHGYYGQYMYFPLLVFDGDTGDIITAILRPGTVHSSQSAVGILKRIVGILKEYFPDTKFIIRGDAGFGVPKMHEYCEKHEFILGLSGNSVLNKKTAEMKKVAERLFEETLEPQKHYATFYYQAESWEKEQQVIAKIEHNRHGSNIRYIITNMRFEDAKEGYVFYTKRGQSENYIKDLKNDLFLDRLSCHKYRANCFRMLLSCFAYTIMQEIRLMLIGTELEGKQSSTIRLKLLKIGARVKETVRKVWIQMSSSFAYQELFLRMLSS